MAPGARVLDVACGSGRHLAWFAGRGNAVTGIDQDISKATHLGHAATLVQADIELGPWPLTTPSCDLQQFDVVVVTNYLWRPLLPTMVTSVAPGGILLYETFADGNAEYGRPSRPDFLLKPGELLSICRDLTVIAYENGVLDEPRRCVQRIVAVRPPSIDQSTSPNVYML